MDCEVRVLDSKTIFFLYRRYVERFFEDEEVLPRSAISNLLARRIYSGYGMYDGDTLVCFGLFFTNPGCSVMLLDYFVTLKKYRGYGYATDFWKLLIKLLICGTGPELKVTSISAAHIYFPRINPPKLEGLLPLPVTDGIFVEMAGVGGMNKRQLRKRAEDLAFYREAGAYMSDIIPCFEGKEYNVLFIPVGKRPGRAELSPLLYSVYKNILPSFEERKKEILRLTE